MSSSKSDLLYTFLMSKQYDFSSSEYPMKDYVYPRSLYESFLNAQDFNLLQDLVDQVAALKAKKLQNVVHRERVPHKRIKTTLQASPLRFTDYHQLIRIWGFDVGGQSEVVTIALVVDAWNKTPVSSTSKRKKRLMRQHVLRVSLLDNDHAEYERCENYIARLCAFIYFDGARDRLATVCALYALAIGNIKNVAAAFSDEFYNEMRFFRMIAGGDTSHLARQLAHVISELDMLQASEFAQWAVCMTVRLLMHSHFKNEVENRKRRPPKTNDGHKRAIDCKPSNFALSQASRFLVHPQYVACGEFAVMSTTVARYYADRYAKCRIDYLDAQQKSDLRDKGYAVFSSVDECFADVTITKRIPVKSLYPSLHKFFVESESGLDIQRVATLKHCLLYVICFGIASTDDEMPDINFGFREGRFLQQTVVFEPKKLDSITRWVNIDNI